MTFHGQLPGLDTSSLPATLNPRIMTDLLRGQLGFRGLVLTDALFEALRLDAILALPASEAVARSADDDGAVDHRGAAHARGLDDRPQRAALRDQPAPGVEEIAHGTVGGVRIVDRRAPRPSLDDGYTVPCAREDHGRGRAPGAGGDDAAGAAAHLALQSGVAPRRLDVGKLQECLERDGAYLGREAAAVQA